MLSVMFLVILSAETPLGPLVGTPLILLFLGVCAIIFGIVVLDAIAIMFLTSLIDCVF